MYTPAFNHQKWAKHGLLQPDFMVGNIKLGIKQMLKILGRNRVKKSSLIDHIQTRDKRENPIIGWAIITLDSQIYQKVPIVLNRN